MEDNIQEMYFRARKAFETVEHWPQKKVDEMVLAVGWEWQKTETAEALAQQAVEESGIGIVKDKVAKIIAKTRGTLWDMRDARTCDVVEEDPAIGLVKFAKPMGVIANIVPCTNPESTVTTLGLSILKTRNAMIVSPHPRTQRSSYLTCEHGRKALRKVGAPEDLIQCIESSSREKSCELISACDFTVATGGASLVEVVHSIGKPCQTVGAGNVVSVIDESANLKDAVAKIVESKTTNNSASCSSENAVAIHESIYAEIIGVFKTLGGYLCDIHEREKLCKTMWPDGVNLNRDVVGRPVQRLAELADLNVPPGARFLMVMGEEPGANDRFSGEKICPVLTVWKWSGFDEVINLVGKILLFSGEGHSVSIHTKQREQPIELARRLNVGRVNCNMPNAMANGGSWSNGQPFSDTMGCGTWAGNITTDNINYRHFLNYTWLSTPTEERVPTDDEIFGSYLAKWGRD